MEKALREGFVYSGEFSAFRKRSHGSPSKDRLGSQFIVFSQNHDQVGNRPQGERLSALVPFEALKLAAAIVILSPYIPLLFMGEEYGEASPFLYFTSHGDQDLAEAVYRGRARDLAHLHRDHQIPNPQDESTFLRSKLRLDLRAEGMHGKLLSFYRQLLHLRQAVPALAVPDRTGLAIVTEAAATLSLGRRNASGSSQAWALFNFDKNDRKAPFPAPMGTWAAVLDSSDAAWGGPGSLFPESVSSGAFVTMRGHSAVLVLSTPEVQHSRH
jgi:maltooligosyltrehalose trehalohydrolase